MKDYMKKPVCVSLWIVYWLADSAVAYWWYFSLIFTETTRVRVRKSILYWKYQDQRATKSRKDSHAGNLCGGHILFMPQWGVLSSTMPWPVSFLFKLGWGRELSLSFCNLPFVEAFGRRRALLPLQTKSKISKLSENVAPCPQQEVDPIPDLLQNTEL